MNIKRKIWGTRKRYRHLVREAIQLFPTMLGHIEVDRLFLCGFTARRSKHIAKISSNRTPWCLLLEDYDYAIQFWDPKFASSPKPVQLYVVFHELWHIPPGGFVEGGPEYRKLKGHDVEDFSWMVDTYGVHMEKVDKILKGEKVLFEKYDDPKKIHRFPRLAVNKAH